MRILFDARGVQRHSDGMSHYVRQLLLHLLALDGPQEYVVLLREPFLRELERRGVSPRPNLHPVVTDEPFMGWRQQLGLRRLIRRLPPVSLYHYPHFDLPLFAHPRSIVTVFDLNQFHLPGYYHSLGPVKRLYGFLSTRASVAKAEHVLTISQASRQLLLQRFPALPSDRVTVTHLGLSEAFGAAPSAASVSAFRERHRLGADRFLLYVGTDRPHKNLNRVLAAFARLRHSCTIPHRLLLVGSSTGDGSVPRAIRSLGLDDAVARIDHVPDEELPAAYRAAEALVFCSLSEGFGMPLIEAMASELPIVTSNLSAMQEIAGTAAILVDPRSVESIAKGMWQVISRDALRKQLIERGQDRVRAFTWDAAARATLEVYRQVGAAASTSDGAIEPVRAAEPVAAMER